MEIEDLYKTEQELVKENVELNKRIKEIQEKRIQMEIALNKIQLDKLREHKGLILNLIEHDRTSCSDENPSNGYGSADYVARCDKCHLIEILNSDWNNEFSVDFNISISRICKR
jgi:hypothetical protein